MHFCSTLYPEEIALRPIAIASGDKKDAGKLKLTPTGALTGRVLDVDGSPMEGLLVRAESSTRNQFPARTDDGGMFRIGGLPPGKYRVIAQPESLPLPPEIRTDGTAEVHYSATYYPNALSAKEASRVEVRAAAGYHGRGHPDGAHADHSHQRTRDRHPCGPGERQRIDSRRRRRRDSSAGRHI